MVAFVLSSVQGLTRLEDWGKWKGHREKEAGTEEKNTFC